jgi:hypothetical protein
MDIDDECLIIPLTRRHLVDVLVPLSDEVIMQSFKDCRPRHRAVYWDNLLTFCCHESDFPGARKLAVGLNILCW